MGPQLVESIRVAQTIAEGREGHIHTYIYIYIHILYTCVYVHKCKIYIYIHTPECMHAYIHAYMHAHTNACTCIYVAVLHAYVCVCAYVYIHTHIHIACVCVYMCGSSYAQRVYTHAHRDVQTCRLRPAQTVSHQPSFGDQGSGGFLKPKKQLACTSIDHDRLNSPVPGSMRGSLDFLVWLRQGLSLQASLLHCLACPRKKAPAAAYSAPSGGTGTSLPAALAAPDPPAEKPCEASEERCVKGRGGRGRGCPWRSVGVPALAASQAATMLSPPLQSRRNRGFRDVPQHRGGLDTSGKSAADDLSTVDSKLIRLLIVACFNPRSSFNAFM